MKAARESHVPRSTVGRRGLCGFGALLTWAGSFAVVYGIAVLIVVPVIGIVGPH